MKQSTLTFALAIIFASIVVSGCTGQKIAESPAPQTEASAETTMATTIAAVPKTAAPKTVTPKVATPKAATTAKKSQPVTVTYTDNGYAPNTITIKTGSRVTFTNKSSTDMWPASAMHPTHNVYPEKGGCVGSKFDACRSIAPGTSWSFIFNQVGSWSFHDHLNPQYRGKIIVQ